MKAVATVKGMTLILLCGLLLLAEAPAARAVGEERPAIVEIELYVEHGHLTGDITTRGVFLERIVGTVLH